MATNPKNITPIDFISSSQLNTLAGGNSITKDGNTLEPDETRVYLTPDESIVVTDTAPTSSTAGYVGQFRLITTTGSEALYICTAEGSTYTWKQVTLS